MGPNQFLKTAADPIGHESAYLRSQGRSLNYRCPDFGRRRRPRLCGAETGRLRVPSPCGNSKTDAPPLRATAICPDGTYSFSEHPFVGGTCSHHGGVASHLTR
jgi:hypothetical protein